MHQTHAHVIFIAIENGTDSCTTGWLFACNVPPAHLKPCDRKCTARHRDKMPHRMHYTQKSVLPLARHFMLQQVLNILKWLDAAEAMQFATHFVHSNVIQYSASNHIRYSPNVLFYNFVMFLMHKTAQR